MKGIYGGNSGNANSVGVPGNNSNNNSRGYPREADDSFFEDNYGQGGMAKAITDSEFWVKCEEYDRLDQSELTFQGRLFQKSLKTKKWQPYHFELYSDRLVRITNSNTLNNTNITSTTTATANTISNNAGLSTNNNSLGNSNGQVGNNTQNSLNNLSTASHTNNNNASSDDWCAEQASLNACYLKKIKYSDNSYANYKFGIRLQRGECKSELFTESADNFNKLYEEIKRFCILPKFAKKYKVLTKFKSANNSGAHLYKCFRFSDSTQYCVKIVDKYALSEQGRAGVLRETSILRRVDHPSIVKLYEVYEDENNVFLVYELLQGKDLRSKLSELLCLDEKSLSDCLWKLLHGLAHLHSRNIMHRDLRLENIFLRAPTSLTDACISNFNLADFADPSKCIGPAALLPPAKPNYKKYGQPGYLAPEVLKNKPYDQKVDIFSLGVIFYLLVFGRPPFEGKDADETMKLNEKCEPDFSQPPYFGKLTSSAFDLMKRMLDKDPRNRPEAAVLLNHTWFVNMRNKSDDSRSVMGNNPNNPADPNGQNNLQAFPTLSTVPEISEPIDESATDLMQGRGNRKKSNNNNNLNGIINSLSNSNNNVLPSSYNLYGSTYNMNNSNYLMSNLSNNQMLNDSSFNAMNNNSVLANYNNNSECIPANNNNTTNVFQDDEFDYLHTDQQPRTSYVFNTVRDGSLIYEDEFVKETLFDKMNVLNRIQFVKVPSKFRHDSLQHYLLNKLGIDISKNANTNTNNNNVLNPSNLFNSPLLLNGSNINTNLLNSPNINLNTAPTLNVNSPNMNSPINVNTNTNPNTRNANNNAIILSSPTFAQPYSNILSNISVNTGGPRGSLGQVPQQSTQTSTTIQFSSFQQYSKTESQQTKTIYETLGQNEAGTQSISNAPPISPLPQSSHNAIQPPFLLLAENTVGGNRENSTQRTSSQSQTSQQLLQSSSNNMTNQHAILFQPQSIQQLQQA